LNDHVFVKRLIL